MERLRRRGAEAHAANPSHPFDPSAPWKWVWSEALVDLRFWKMELEDPALLIMTRTRATGNFIDGDATVAGAAGARHDGGDLHHGGSSAPPPRRQLGDRDPPINKRKERKPDNQAAISDGKYTATRQGIQLCRAFNEGTCHGTNSQGRCKQNPSRAHQCWFCLNSAHAGCNCNLTSAPSSVPASKYQKRQERKGKGKGKGKIQ